MSDITWHPSAVDHARRAAVTGGVGATVWLTGLSGSGKSTIAVALEEALIDAGRAAYRLDGDNVRHGLNSDLGFNPEDRTENVRRIGEVARLLSDAGVVAIAAAISPYVADREKVREMHEAAERLFLEVFIDVPLDVCERRDPKGLYRRARTGELSGMTGIDAPYEAPVSPEICLRHPISVPTAVERIVQLLPA